MKSVTFIVLSVYMLLLAVLPCTDGYLRLRSDSKVTTVMADQHAHDETVGDLCSPFCHCVCCGTVLDTPAVFRYQPIHPLPAQRARFTGPVLPLPSPMLSAWQPPQLA